MASTRPRRSTRKPDSSAAAQPQHASTSTPTKRLKATDDIDYLLTNPKSKLTTMDLTDLFNIEIWAQLSEESRNKLIKLLPPTAFTTFVPKIDPNHPSVLNAPQPEQMEVDEACGPQPSLETFDPSFFTDPHFTAALRTFQDHLYTGWMTPAHKNDVETYINGIRSGILHAPWKDQVWEHDRREEEEGDDKEAAKVTAQRELRDSHVGDAKEVRLVDLLKSGTIKPGDILVYKRYFSASGLTVEKDVMVKSYYPNASSFQVLISPGTTQHLPQGLALAPEPEDFELLEGERLLEMSVSTPSSLETGVLDVDGRVDKSRRPNGNAWKAISAWKRRSDGDFGTSIERGGRENAGTLFYLRSCLYYDH